ncbi:MAG: hypothetical protein IJ593_04805 [Lachnospiraceae bacterium]|nr:hypothetical protein [Lachnospiraceae bacterium]
MKSGSTLFTYAGTSNGAVTLAIVSIIILSVVMITIVTNLNIFQLFKKLFETLLGLSGRLINQSEKNYHRDLAIGKIDEKRRKVKIYRFLNDLVIDLGYKQSGVTPYEFLFIVTVLVLLASIIICQILFGNLFIVLLVFPIVFIATLCILYTKANVSHDRRIEAIIEAENIICNNISGGVLVAVKQSIDVIPTEVRMEFRDFIDNVESKNYHIKTALMELNSYLGSTADDFIKKCIIFEMEEEHGIVNMFKDVVEVNTIKMEMRVEMKRRFEEVTQSFIIGAVMIFVFLAGVIAIFAEVRDFYFNTLVGQLVLCIDALIIILEYVYITYLRAKEV